MEEQLIDNEYVMNFGHAHGTLGSYLRDVLQEGDATAFVHAPRTLVYLPPFPPPALLVDSIAVFVINMKDQILHHMLAYCRTYHLLYVIHYTQ
jgi:hypothetical protein